jgi:uncharacterized protein YjiS (DUF1127 family)
MFPGVTCEVEQTMSILMRLVDRYRASQAARRVRNELSLHTARELADLGLSRHDIPDLAREAARQYLAEARAARLRHAPQNGVWANLHA